MIRIFEPIISFVLVYVDDILIFSKTFEDHLSHLYKFAQIVESYGIMLFEKEMVLAVNEVQFLGTHISQDTCTPRQHLAQALTNFPEQDLTKTHIQ